MKDLLTISGLIVNLVGCGMLYLENARLSGRLPMSGVVIYDETEKTKKMDRFILVWCRLGFTVMAIGFALQVLAYWF